MLTKQIAKKMIIKQYQQPPHSFKLSTERCSTGCTQHGCWCSIIRARRGRHAGRDLILDCSCNTCFRLVRLQTGSFSASWFSFCICADMCTGAAVAQECSHGGCCAARARCCRPAWAGMTINALIAIVSIVFSAATFLTVRQGVSAYSRGVPV